MLQSQDRRSRDFRRRNGMMTEAEVPACHRAALPAGLTLVIFVAFLTVAPVFADVHPVPLDKNTDSAKCLECHNSDDNREFGGLGPNGPHGSKWTHILERRYEFSQTRAPGQLIGNLFPTPDLSVNGPYALCGKCHDLTRVIANTSFAQHALHINAGFSCSTCHASHGMGGLNGNVTGDRLVNFDINVVAPNGAKPISYNRATGTCSLRCHMQAH